MHKPHTIEASLKHPGTGRLAAVVRVEALWSCAPLALTSAQPYLLVMASDHPAQLPRVETARAWLEAGACYVCAWGPGASEMEETFDYAAFLPELGDPLPFSLVTTSHPGETLEEALQFAFNFGKPPGRTADEDCPVVVVVDSAALAAQSTSWIQQHGSKAK